MLCIKGELRKMQHFPVLFCIFHSLSKTISSKLTLNMQKNKTLEGN